MGVVVKMGAAYAKLEEDPRWQKLPRWVKFGAVSVIAQIVAFWGPNAFLHLCYNNRLFERYKLQKNMLPPPALITAALQDNLKSTLVMLPLLAWPIHKLLTLGGGGGGKSGPASDNNNNASSDHPNDAKEGWSQMHFGRQNMPSWKKVAAQVWGAYAMYDFMFYFSHRALHNKFLYQHIHKQHHQFSVSIGIASSYQHVLEGAAQMLNWYVPVGLAGYFGGGIHISTVFWYNCLRWVETVDAHCGYHFPWSPFAAIPLFGGAIQHDFHHSGEGLEFIKLPDGSTFAEFGNYGASVVWDYLLGTFSPEYTEYRSAILEGRTPGDE